MAEITEYNVAHKFNRQSSNGKLAFINKGSMNKIFMRPQIINANVSQYSTLQGTVTSSNIVGQVFKAEKDNINGITLPLGNGNTQTVLDDFESYADSTALRVEWVLTGSKAAELKTDIVSPNDGSTKSMKLKTEVLADTWTNSISSTNFTEATFHLDHRQEKDFSTSKMSLFIGDGVNTKSIQICASAVKTWETFELMESAMTEDGTGTTNTGAITEIGFTTDLATSKAVSWVDNFRYCLGTGSVNIKLYDMGSSIPESGTTSINTGTQYTTIGDTGINGSLVSEYELTISGTTRAYQINGFIAGAAKELASNNSITVGNYYLITLNYIDININVMGVDPALSENFYADGYAFTAPDESTAITAIGPYNDIGFAIFSTQDIHIIFTQIRMFDADGAQASPGELAQYQEYTEDLESDITQHIVTAIKAYNNGDRDLRNRPVFVEDGGKVGAVYQDDGNDNVYKVIFNIIYLYESN